jgi:hypothetical protein
MLLSVTYTQPHLDVNNKLFIGEKWENVRYMKISNAILGINKDTATGSGGGMNIREYHCEKCDITVNSQTQLDQHLQSNKHKMKDVQPANNSQKKRKRPATGMLKILFKQSKYAGPTSCNMLPLFEHYVG